MPSSPRSQKLYTFTLRSAKMLWRGVGQRVEHLDHAALLGDEDAPVVGEPDDRRVRQTAEDNRLLEPGRQGGRLCRRRHDRSQNAGSQHQQQA